jgi:hypothetical protein
MAFAALRCDGMGEVIVCPNYSAYPVPLPSMPTPTPSPTPAEQMGWEKTYGQGGSNWPKPSPPPPPFKR